MRIMDKDIETIAANIEKASDIFSYMKGQESQILEKSDWERKSLKSAFKKKKSHQKKLVRFKDSRRKR